MLFTIMLFHYRLQLWLAGKLHPMTGNKECKQSLKAIAHDKKALEMINA